MKRLNPLYILALLMVILFISFSLLNEQKGAYELSEQELNNISTLSKDYKNLRASWDNEKYVNQTLDSILKSRSFRNKKSLKVKVNKAIKVKLESSDPRDLNRFLNKVLNKKLLLKKMTLEKNYISLEVGVK